MIVRFCMYSVLKNLRFADPFLLLFLLDRGFSLTVIGLWLGAQHLVTTGLEIPFGVLADRFGRRRSLTASFLAYTGSFTAFVWVDTEQLGALAVALGLFGVGEALRTGSHKAIMLDWLDQRGEGHRVVEVVGLTRTWSRISGALAALTGGLLLYGSQSWELLFGLSALAAAGGFVLLLSYPKSLEGEQQRTPGPRPAIRQRLVALTERGLGGLMLQSVLFESQVKLVRKYYLQPFLKQGLALIGLPVLGAGALAIAAVEVASELLGAVGARSSARFERWSGGLARALRVAYLSAIVAAIALVISAWTGSIWPGVLAAMGAWLLQNARRPVFVAAFNQHMDKPQRATTLSVESLARTVVLSALLPICGVLADHFGLWAAFALVGVILGLGALVPQPELS